MFRVAHRLGTVLFVAAISIAGCAPNSVSSPTPPPPAKQVQEGLTFDAACSEYYRVAQLLHQAVGRGISALEAGNFALSGSISENSLELLFGLGSVDIQDENLSQLISNYVAAAASVESHFVELATVVDTYGPDSSQAVAFSNDPSLEILLEELAFRRSLLHSACDLP